MYLPRGAYVPAYVYVAWVWVYMKVHVLCMHVGIHRVQCITVLQVTMQPHEYCICQQHCCCVLVVCLQPDIQFVTEELGIRMAQMTACSAYVPFMKNH